MAIAPTSIDSKSAIAIAATLRDEFALTASATDRTAAFPFANFEALRDAGILNLTVDEKHGGPGLGLETACRVVSLIAEGEPSTALVYAMHLIYNAVP
ncbi:MAG: acyl-CoA dehydrogenase family protein, partial [bacterium]